MGLSKRHVIRSRWPEVEFKLFGKTGCEGLNDARVVCRDLIKAPVSYEFISEKTFQELMAQGVCAANQIYWREMVYRSHFAAVTSLVRNLSWISGMTAAIAADQFLPFSACARSLLESTADSWSTLRRIPSTLLGQHKSMIQEAVDGSLETILINEDLESHLLHFSHGRKIEKGEKDFFPQEHNAKQPWEYLKDYKLSGGSQSVVNFYAELCQLVHPAMDSVFYLAEVFNSKEKTIVKVPVSSDKKMIQSTINHNKQNFLEILKLAIGAPIDVLKAVNEFGLNDLHLPVLKKVNI